MTVKATGTGVIQEIKIDPKAIDPDDPELLEDTVLAAVNEALRAAQALAESKLGGSLGGLGCPACRTRPRRKRPLPLRVRALIDPARVAGRAST